MNVAEAHAEEDGPSHCRKHKQLLPLGIAPAACRRVEVISQKCLLNQIACGLFFGKYFTYVKSIGLDAKVLMLLFPKQWQKDRWHTCSFQTARDRAGMWSLEVQLEFNNLCCHLDPALQFGWGLPTCVWKCMYVCACSFSKASISFAYLVCGISQDYLVLCACSDKSQIAEVRIPVAEVESSVVLWAADTFCVAGLP